MHRTGRYRTLTLICGVLPFISALMISTMTADSHPLLLWMGIVCVLSFDTSFLSYASPQFPLGFGNAVVLQTMLSELPHSSIPMETNIPQSLCYRTYQVCTSDIASSHSDLLTSTSLGARRRYRFQPALPRRRPSRRRRALRCNIPDEPEHRAAQAHIRPRLRRGAYYSIYSILPFVAQN